LNQSLDDVTARWNELRALCRAGSENAAAAMSEALWDLLTSVEVAPQPA